MISLDQGQSVAPIPGQGGLAALRSVVCDKCTQPISDLQQKLPEHTKRHIAIELNNCQFQLSQQEKDCQFWVADFFNKA